jgi:hypothetical protein
MAGQKVDVIPDNLDLNAIYESGYYAHNTRSLNFIVTKLCCHSLSSWKVGA